MTRLGDRVRAYVLFATDEGLDPDESDLFARANGIGGVTVVRDDGTQADLLGARTSGQVYLYAEDGALVFAGGITPSRSHEGDSVGRQRLLSLVGEGDADRPSSDVFGCGLDNGETE